MKLYDPLLEVLEAEISQKPKEKIKPKPTFSVKITGINTACADVFVQTNMKMAASFYSAAVNDHVGEMTRYVNYTGLAMVVINRHNVPQLIEPSIPSDKTMEGMFLMIKHVFFRNKQAFHMADEFMAKLMRCESERTAEDEALVQSYRSGFGIDSRVLTITYGYDEVRLRSETHVYDPVLDVVIYPHRQHEASFNHPHHDLSSANAMSSRVVTKPRSGVFFSLSCLKPRTLYVKLATGVVAVNSHQGPPVLICDNKGEQDKPSLYTDYVKVTTVDNEGKEVNRYYTIKRAFDELGFFETEKAAEDHGNYALSDTAAWKRAQAEHERELARITMEHRLEMDKRVQEASLKAMEEQNKIRREHEELINAIRVEKDKLAAKFQQDKAEIEKKLLEMGMERDRREAEHRQQLDDAKLKQTHVEHHYSSSSQSMKNTGEGLKLGVAVVTAVVAVGAYLWKTFSFF